MNAAIQGFLDWFFSRAGQHTLATVVSTAAAGVAAWKPQYATPIAVVIIPVVTIWMRNTEVIARDNQIVPRSRDGVP